MAVFGTAPYDISIGPSRIIGGSGKVPHQRVDLSGLFSQDEISGFSAFMEDKLAPALLGAGYTSSPNDFGGITLSETTNKLTYTADSFTSPKEWRIGVRVRLFGDTGCVLGFASELPVVVGKSWW